MQGVNSFDRVIAQVSPNNPDYTQYAAYTAPVSSNGYDYNAVNNPNLDPDYANYHVPDGYVAYESNAIDDNQIRYHPDHAYDPNSFDNNHLLYQTDPNYRL
jgi:hypothetical protein